MRINLVYLDNRAGLSRGAQIMAQVLAGAGATVALSNAIRWNRAENALIPFFGGMPPARHDVNIFLEHVVPDWLPFARFKVLMPNLKWFSTAAPSVNELVQPAPGLLLAIAESTPQRMAAVAEVL